MDTMKIDTSFNAAFTQLQNGVNDARKAAGDVISATNSENVKPVEAPADVKRADGDGGINVTA